MLTTAQKIAKFLGKKDGSNTWFPEGINHPDNVNISLGCQSSIALGAIKAHRLPEIIKEGGHFSNLFCDPLD